MPLYISAHGRAALHDHVVNSGDLTYLDERVPVEQAVVLVAHLKESSLLQHTGRDLS